VSDQDQNQLDAVRKRVKEIQRARRSGIRWRITKHTAELTMRALEGSEARRIKVLYHFYDRRRIVPFQTLVAVHQRTMNQPNAFFLLRRQTIKMQPLAGNLKASVRDIHADDFGKRFFLQKRPKQLSFSASHIYYPLGIHRP